MFTTSNITAARVGRWALVTAVIAIAVLGISGRWFDPWLWAYVAVFSGAGLYAAWNLTEDVARERFRPPDPGADRLWLRAARFLALAHVIVGALDVGRWHLTSVPTSLRATGLVIMIFAVALVFRAMIVNQFFSAVVRIQTDRGHHVIDRGPYGWIRHPGYAGMIPAIPAAALVLGSWLGVALALAYSALMLRRVWFEDAYLHAHLEGYVDYATRVRYRLIPGLW
jgi:protein-S-isoprenylcysteine O-methyltransferase Ste14